ncbi:recombinase family protein [Frankia sp. R82]|uniref:recombinase family protein n=1 Tax=Frankia sp. R82 TaxID=2950553 RepID=UPI002044C233|nr:recombinase family protein [Frankia sp. R82]MCM3884301.1 recombinase family protein [Frankia sp. R82]
MGRTWAYGYLSLTGDDKQEISKLHRQVTVFADAESYTLAEVYVDRNMPPGRLIRPGLSVLLDCLRAREGCCVIVPTSDHLSTWAAIRKAIEMEIQLLGGTLLIATGHAHGETGSG